MIVDIHNIIAKSLPAEEDDSYYCIRFIDPYGDTVFNHIQAKTLLIEWDSIHDFFVSKGAEQLWTDIRNLISFCASDKGIHCYIVFIGD